MRKAFFLFTVSLIFIVASIPAQGQSTDSCAEMIAHWSDALGYNIGRPFVRYEVYNQQISILEGNPPEQLLCTIPTRLVVRDSCQAPARP